MGSRIGVRARITLIAVVVVGVVLATGAVLLLTVTRARLESSIGDAAEARADGIVALVQADVLPDPLPGGDPELLAQVVDSSGAVVASDAAVAHLDPFAPITVATGERIVHRPESLFERYEPDRFEDDGPYVLVVHGVALPSGPGRVLVAASLEDAAEALAVVRPLLGIGLPMLLLVVGVIAWMLTGRALRPVERMRAEASRISAEDLHRRLPLPGSRDEIRRLATTLNDMLDRLEESAVRRRRFVSDASHELRSPLAALRTMVDVAGRDTEAPLSPDLADDLRHEIDRMQRLVDDLLYLTRADEGLPEAATGEIDLDRLLADEARRLRVRTALHIDSTGILPARVAGDPDRLIRMIRNLTDNARRHAAGTIRLASCEQNGTAVVVVADDGVGIPEPDRERVFGRFVRLDASRSRDSGGSGLGLAVAREIARSHRGDLRVIDTPLGGAAFEASFPAC